MSAAVRPGVDSLVAAAAAGRRLLLLFDFDGTLSPTVPRPEQARGEDEIVVLAMELIKGHVADCKGRPDDPGPQTNPAPVAGATSPDGTLHWLAQQRGDGVRRFVVLSNKAGEWDEVLDISFNPG